MQDVKELLTRFDAAQTPGDYQIVQRFAAEQGAADRGQRIYTYTPLERVYRLLVEGLCGLVLDKNHFTTRMRLTIAAASARRLILQPLQAYGLYYGAIGRVISYEKHVPPVIRFRTALRELLLTRPHVHRLGADYADLHAVIVAMTAECFARLHCTTQALLLADTAMRVLAGIEDDATPRLVLARRLCREITENEGRCTTSDPEYLPLLYTHGELLSTLPKV